MIYGYMYDDAVAFRYGLLSEVAFEINDITLVR